MILTLADIIRRLILSHSCGGDAHLINHQREVWNGVAHGRIEAFVAIGVALTGANPDQAAQRFDRAHVRLGCQSTKYRRQGPRATPIPLGASEGLLSNFAQQMTESKVNMHV